MTTPDDIIRRIYLHHYDRAVELIPTLQQSQVLQLIRKNAAPTPSTAVAAHLNVSIKHANVLLRKLRLNGYVKRVAHLRADGTGGFEYHYEVATC